MPKALSSDAIDQYRGQGYFSPYRIMSEAEAASLRAQLESFEAAQGHPIDGDQRSKAHLMFKWLDDIIRDGRLLDAVEDLIGPNILCWNTVFWIKEANTPTYVSWHQDLNYWGLTDGAECSCWLALSPASLESGCMSIMAGSHIGELLPHQDLYEANNLLTRGQEIQSGIDEAKVVAMPLNPGEISIHDGRVAHASGPNNSGDRRIGISMHFVPTHARQSIGSWDSAALVRGVDSFRHFEHTPIPATDMDPVALAFQRKAAVATSEIVYHGADRNTQRI